MAHTPTIRLRMLVMITTIAVALLLLASAVYASGQPVPTIDYTVQSGDNLWTIAVEHTPQGTDVRATLGTIKQINGLDGSLIFAGQTLELPSP